jgi:hypothetical protein
MGILPDNLFGSEGLGTTGGGGLLGGLPAWLFDAQQLGLPQSWANTASAAPPSAAQTPAQPPAGFSAPPSSSPAGGDFLANLRAAIPQGLADNSNTLLAFGGGALKGGIGQGLTDASKIGVHESDLLKRHKFLSAQQAATVEALRNAGLQNPEAVAAIHPALARVLLAHSYPR